MATSRIWIETAIPGFMFVLGGVCLALTILGYHDFSPLVRIKDLLPYLAAVVVAMSLVVGFIIRRAVQLVGGFLFPAIERLFKLDALPAVTDSGTHVRDLVDTWQYGSERLHQELEFLFAMHAMFQSLVVAIPFLGVSLALWTATGQMIELSLILVGVTALLTPLAYIVYRTQRRNLLSTQAIARAAIAQVKANGPQ